MSRSGRNGGQQRGAGGTGATASSAAGAKAGTAASGKNDGPDRPGASGHRFGPDLACSECGILWDVHQREPKPCKIETVTDVFTRRPSGDFENSAATDTTETAARSGATEAAAKSTNED